MPNSTPAFGSSAVPLPMKVRKTLPGCHPPTADAATDEATGAEGPDVTPDSRRVKTAAAPTKEETTTGDTGDDAGAEIRSSGPTPAAPTPARSDESSRADRVPTVTATPAAPVERPPRALTTDEDADEDADKDLPLRTTRDGPRDGVLGEVADTDGESDTAEPVDPTEPDVSANANGTDAIAEPTPRATANAPTRPTYREYPEAAGWVTTRRRY